ncbi:MAG: hypothetical protein ABSG76_23725 [Xanthobacteraceae bacterium]
MPAKPAVIALALLCLCGRAPAGVLSATDAQRLRDYEQRVIPADRETPSLRDLATRVEALIALAESAGAAFGGGAAVDVHPMVRDFPAGGGRALEMMVGSLRTIDDPRAFSPAEWIAMLAEVKAEIAERLDYDAAVLKAYQRTLAPGAPSLEQSLIRYDERPDAAAHWSRFQQTRARSPGF